MKKCLHNLVPLLSFLFFFTWFPSPSAKADSLAELQAQLASLQTQLQTAQQILESTPCNPANNPQACVTGAYMMAATSVTSLQSQIAALTAQIATATAARLLTMGGITAVTTLVVINGYTSYVNSTADTNAETQDQMDRKAALNAKQGACQAWSYANAQYLSALDDYNMQVAACRGNTYLYFTSWAANPMCRGTLTPPVNTAGPRPDGC